MPNFTEYLNKTLEILRSEKKTLKTLAEISGLDVFRFFNHGDLRDLDLSHKDLTGLNFFGADFSNTKLDEISYDAGAFNGARLPEKYAILIDDFEFCLSDILDDLFRYVYVFVQFRTESLEKAITNLRVSYQSLAERSNINVSTLRKARRSEVVSLETAQSIASSLLEIEEEKSTDVESQLNFNVEYKKRRKNIIMQPMIKLIQFSNNDRFTTISSEYLKYFTDHKELIKSSVYDGRTEPGYRFTPSVIASLLT